MFSTMGNNKGLVCPFKPIICQEGYCQECQSFLKSRLGEQDSLSGENEVRQESKDARL